MKIIKQLKLVCVAVMGTAAIAVAADEIVAKGDGFAISKQDIVYVREYFLEKGLGTNEGEYINGALKLYLFSKEAEAIGLVAKSDELLTGKEKIGRLYQIHRIYVNHLQESYPLKEEAIESYYYAYPEKFTKSIPLYDKDRIQVHAQDAEIKEWIRKRIIAAKKTTLVENEFRRLKEKYHVRIDGDQK